MLRKLRANLYATMEVPAIEDNQGGYYEVLMMSLIFANAFAMIVATVPSIKLNYDWFLMPFEHISIIIFSLEYLLLLWVCTENPAYQDPVYGRIRYAMTPIALINLISVIPAFIPVLEPYDLRVLRMFRLFRFFRILKLTKYSDSIQTLFKALDAKKEQLFMTLVIFILLVVMASVFLFYAENGANESAAFNDIPSTIWYSMVTLNPMSNEEGYPVTVAGKLIAAGLALLEIGIFAIPAGIMASAFEEQYNEKQKDKDEKPTVCEEEFTRKDGPPRCPHCGKSYTDEGGGTLPDNN
ncbi:MAG TPA: ion transporter [Methanoregula sp.]|nr:ion transporter [Methanoregula sp.]